MMPSLVGAADDNAMPKTDRFLFVGGPKHGQRLEVIDGDPIFKTFAPSPDGFEVHTYVKREIGLQEDVAYVRAIYVHEVIPSPEVAQQMLMAALMTEFVKGGRKVIDSDVSNRGSAS